MPRYDVYSFKDFKEDEATGLITRKKTADKKTPSPGEASNSATGITPKKTAPTQETPSLGGASNSATELTPKKAATQEPPGPSLGELIREIRKLYTKLSKFSTEDFTMRTRKEVEEKLEAVISDIDKIGTLAGNFNSRTFPKLEEKVDVRVLRYETFHGWLVLRSSRILSTSLHTADNPPAKLSSERTDGFIPKDLRKAIRDFHSSFNEFLELHQTHAFGAEYVKCLIRDTSNTTGQTLEPQNSPVKTAVAAFKDIEEWGKKFEAFIEPNSKAKRIFEAVYGKIEVEKCPFEKIRNILDRNLRPELEAWAQKI